MRDKLRQQGSAVVWSLMLVMSLGAVTFGVAAAAPHSGSKWPAMPQDTSFQNYTMHLYRGSTHSPGEEEVSIWYEIIVHGLPDDDRRAWLNMSVTATPWVSACQLQDLQAFAIDRKPPDNGTGGSETDYPPSEYDHQVTSVDTDVDNTTRGAAGIQQYRYYLGKETHSDEKHWEFPLSSNGWDAEFLQGSRVKFWDRQQAESDGTDRQTQPRTTFEYENMDRVVVDYANCYTNPSDPGWYRATSLSETYWADERDTAPDDQTTGAPENQNFAPVTYSHWVYICECNSYDDAVNQLGPPPEMNGTKVANPDEFRPTYTGEGTPTPTPGEETPTPTATATPDGTATPTQEDTPTPTEDGTDTPVQTTVAETTMPDDGGDDSPTPQSDGGGPGFGVVAALLALIGAALLARRRA